jgi:hypothetical protein
MKTPPGFFPPAVNVNLIFTGVKNTAKRPVKEGLSLRWMPAPPPACDF